MQMPTQIKVGPQLFTILEKTRKEDSLLNEGNYGYTLDQFNRIVIDKDMHKSKKQSTVLHELMHAARMVWQTPTQPTSVDSFEVWEHFFIGLYENSILMLLQDNPDLRKWLFTDE
jgi:hypothetical protein